MRNTRHGVIEEVAIMIKTGASEDTIENFIHKMYANSEIGDRTFSLLEGMVIDHFYK